MDIDIAQSPSHQQVLFDELQDFIMFGILRGGESLEQLQNLFSVVKIAAGQFTDDKGMADDLSILKQSLEPGYRVVKMAHPNRRIHQDHDYAFGDLRLGIGRRAFSVPPNRASLRLLSRAIKASNPKRTSDVFSSIFVRAEALSKSS